MHQVIVGGETYHFQTETASLRDLFADRDDLLIRLARSERGTPKYLEKSPVFANTC